MNPLGYRILRLDEVGSTNTLILENDRYLDDPGLVVLAHHQTAGRGRIGRRWISLPGAQLQFSAVVHPSGHPAEIGVVSLIAGLSVAEAVEELLGLKPALKWPNDVLLGGRKVCGILTESKPGERGQPRLVIGIGINCNGGESDFPPDLQPLLTTLQQGSGQAVDLEAALRAVLSRLEENLSALWAGRRAALLRAWRVRALPGERRVRIANARPPREGRAAGIDAEGRLLIRLPDGSLHAHASGEIEWLE